MTGKENQVVPCICNSDGTEEDLEVDIVGCSSSRDVRMAEETDETDDTDDESMSSFSGTFDTENDFSSGGGDDEVESIMFPVDCAPPFFGGYQSRRKRLTEHWKKFIHPVMWRCKWVELKCKELRSQALKNDDDLAEIGKELHEMFRGEGFEGKSRPFSCSFQRKRVMKRKKRKRYEEMTDSAPFMLQQHLLSYREMKMKIKEAEKKNGDPPLIDGSTFIVDNGSAFWYGWESPQSKRFDSVDEEILMKIEAMHSRVRMLRSRIDVLVTENPGKFSSDFLASSGNPGSLVKTGDREAKQFLRASPHLVCEDPRFDDLIPANAASPSSGEVSLPDMSEGMNWPFDEESPFELDQYFATDDQPAREEMMHDLEGFNSPVLEKEKPGSPNNKQQSATTTITPSNDPQSQAVAPLPKTMNCPGKSIPKSRFRVTSMKRKRGKRKPGVSGWRSKIIMKKK